MLNIVTVLVIIKTTTTIKINKLSSSRWARYAQDSSLSLQPCWWYSKCSLILTMQLANDGTATVAMSWLNPTLMTVDNALSREWGCCHLCQTGSAWDNCCFKATWATAHSFVPLVDSGCLLAFCLAATPLPFTTSARMPYNSEGVLCTNLPHIYPMLSWQTLKTA